MAVLTATPKSNRSATESVFGEWGKDAPRVIASEDYWRQAVKGNRQAERKLEMSGSILEVRDTLQCFMRPRSTDDGNNFELRFSDPATCRVEHINVDEPFVEIEFSSGRGELVLLLSPQMARELGEALTSLPSPEEESD